MVCTLLDKFSEFLPDCPLPITASVQAIDIDECIKTVSGASTMHKLTFTYSSIMPSLIRASFFNAELERHPLATHEYCERETVQSMRQMKDVNPVDFVQLTLKSKMILKQHLTLFLVQSWQTTPNCICFHNQVTGPHNSTVTK